MDLTDAQAASRCDITAYYTYDGIWNVSVRPDLSEQQFNPVIWGYLIEDETIDTDKIANKKITLPKIADLSGEGYLTRGGTSGEVEEFDASSSGYILIGNGTTVNSIPISGDATLLSTGALTIINNAVTTAKILDSNITTAKLESNLKYELIPLQVSFETGEVGDVKIKLPFPGTVFEIYSYAIKAISATDNGTIVFKNNAGTTMADGTITYTASDPRGTAYTSAPSTNNTFSVGEYLTITTAKVTVGGKIQLSIKYIRS